MNPNPSTPDPSGTPLPEALRWQLRSLRQPRAPDRDLWPGIAARLADTPQLPARASTRAPALRRWRVPASLAAALLVAWGVLGLMRQPPTTAPAPAPAATPTLVQIEAAGLTRQYQAAVTEVAMLPASPALQSTIEELDRSAALIRDALERDPDSRLLLDQLRRTYTHRLALAQRMA